MAAEYLMNRGFRKFAFCGLNDTFWSAGRKEGFTKKIAEAGFEVHCYKQPGSKAMRLWKNEEAILCNWLRSLPKPIGLTACNDDRAHHVTEACKLIGLHVPEDVAVLGVDNDEFVCELSNPPISSISYNSERAGYDAAAILDKMMGGKKVTQQTILIPATHVITRRSTDILAVEDRTVAEALRFIREHAHRAIQVQDVAEAVALSRVTLCKRFHTAIGRSPSKEIKRARIEYITRLLVETSLPVSNIASSLGYTSLAHIARYFQDEKGMSLTAYRKKYSVA
jgi:LacI family transcriptional regulator